MAIHKIKIKNFKCFNELFELELNKGLNILVGNNETGKSTILEAIHLALVVDNSSKILIDGIESYRCD